jgi:renalase
MHSDATDICILGAGISGLSAAGVLHAAGRSVVVLEKSRGLGGRAATRRIDDTPVDHGAQFFTARTPEFLAQVRRWQEAGVCFEWARGFHHWAGGTLRPAAPDDGAPRFACAAGMTSLARAMAGSLIVEKETRVISIEQVADRFEIRADDGSVRVARAVLISSPAAQTLQVAGPLFSAAQQRQLEACSFLPCLAVIAETTATPDWKGIQFRDHPVLDWIGADFTKRLQPRRRLIVLHATAPFSALHQDADLHAAGEAILAAASEIDPVHLSSLQLHQIHRWRFARHAVPQEGISFLRAPSSAPLLAIGDAFLGGRIESAWLSGRAAARFLLDAGFPG